MSAWGWSVAYDEPSMREAAYWWRERMGADRHTAADLAMALQLARLIDEEGGYILGGRRWEDQDVCDWLRRCVEQELGR